MGFPLQIHYQPDGGTIEVTSCQGKGTTFVVQLDLELADKEKRKEEQAAAHKEKRSRAKDKSFLKGHRIMLVEDNELNREIAYELLSEQGLIVDAVENGKGKHWSFLSSSRKTSMS